MSDERNKASTRPGGPGGPGRHGRPMGPGHGPGGMMPGEKAKNFKATMVKLVAYIGRYKLQVLLVVGLTIVSQIFNVIGPKVLGQATDELYKGVMGMVSGTGTGIDFAKIGTIMLTLIGLYLMSAAFGYLQGYIMTGVTTKMTYQMRDDLNKKIHRLPFNYYDKTTTGEVLSRITNDVDTVGNSLGQSATQIIMAIVSVIGTFVMMLTISWQLTLVAVLMIPASFVSVIAIVKKSQGHFKRQQEYLGHVNGHIEEMYGAHVLVKAFNSEDDSIATFDKYNNTLYTSAWKANFLSGLMMPITGFIGNIGYVAICILGGHFAVTGAMTVGGIQSFVQYVRTFTQPISQIANISNVLQQTAAAAERVFEFLEEPDEPEDAPGFGAVALKPEVEFEHVTFGYMPEETVIRDFSAKIKPGQKIAIVGPTGAGKSTIVKLLMRFYDVGGGRILIDGHDIRDFKRSEARSVFGMVLQDTWLFNGTIAENIRYGRLDATDDEVRSAAKAAQAHHFIKALPDSYNMELNEEASNVSQGQKQLLTIARAILADPQILILDEATSNVDTRTEILIQKAMDNLMHGRTSFVIAHRLSTIRNADLILVMNDGDIVEQGTHDELIAAKGFYEQLYNSQFETSVA